LISTGQSEVVALWIVENETWGVVKRGVETFMAKNSAWQETRVIMADKDMVRCYLV
jgi:hypothetical protein